MFTAFRALTITTPSFPRSSNRPSNALLSRLRPAVPVLLKQFSSELKTVTEISLTPLIKLIIGETAGGPRSDEGSHDGDHAQVRLAFIHHF
jgi:hypothetical protein